MFNVYGCSAEGSRNSGCFTTKELSKFLTQELLELVKQITGESALKGILRPLELNYHLTTI